MDRGCGGVVSSSGPRVADSDSFSARESVAAHDLAKCDEVGRAVDGGVEDGCDFAEVVGAEDARCDDCERLRIDIVRIVELVNGTARDAEHVAGSTSIGESSIVQVSTPSSP